MFQEYIEKSTKKVINTLEIAVSELAALKQNMLTPLLSCWPCCRSLIQRR